VLVSEVAEVLARVSETETILLVEQNLGVVQRLARDAVVLDQGRVVYSGSAQELLGDQPRVRTLLGVGAH
jgi:branched-chain amino acid transport system ATP-binding protein